MRVRVRVMLASCRGHGHCSGGYSWGLGLPTNERMTEHKHALVRNEYANHAPIIQDQACLYYLVDVYWNLNGI